MSESRFERISSRFTSGSVFDTGMVPPAGTAPAELVPGSISMYMSLSPVLGLSRSWAFL